ncbi:MAG TPA: DUF5069 domain-containing protein [Candidatus Acidoferrales bacterium]|nr:DUF5069 domain-containing protein [Candidatus Acidoferrales bacterium]
MATDFRSGRDFPRRGREEYGGYYWLLRVFDKGRASHLGTIHDYIYPCPLDKGVFERWGITPEQFDEAVRTCDTDEKILSWVRAHVSDEKRKTANEWVLVEKKPSLDKQDAEEGVVAA